MKKTICAIIAATAMMVLAVGCGANKAAEEGTTQAGEAVVESSEQAEEGENSSRNDNLFIVGFDENFPPMGFLDENNKHTGFDIELAEIAADKMGKELKLQPVDWDSKELELNSKKIDVIWNGLTITEDRLQNMAFTKPYLKNRQIILVKKDSLVSAKADLAEKVIGVQKGSSGQEAVEKDTETRKSIKEVNEYPDFIAAFMDLEIGRIEAVVADEIVAKYYMTQNPDKFVVLSDDFGSEEYGVGMRLNDTVLQEQLQTALDSMVEDGSAAAVSEKWFGEDIILRD